MSAPRTAPCMPGQGTEIGNTWNVSLLIRTLVTIELMLIRNKCCVTLLYPKPIWRISLKITEVSPKKGIAEGKEKGQRRQEEVQSLV